METILGLFIPFAGTILGACMVFFTKNTLSNKFEKLLLGLAAGVMIAASIWSLIIPSIEMAENQNVINWLPATVGFILGIIFLIVIDILIFKLEKKINFKNLNENIKNNIMLLIAVTLHNIPEGMAVGVAFAGVMIGNIEIALAAAFSLSLGIAIQNIPEGAIISIPLKANGVSSGKSFLYGFFSGIVEPIAGFITILITSKIITILPYLLSFAAGAMMYVVCDELIPEAQKNTKSKIGIIGVTIGFLLMMILDVSLG